MRVPRATNGVDVVEAPVVLLVGDRLLVNGQSAGDVGALTRAGYPREVPELTAVLAARRAQFHVNEPGKEFHPDWLLSLPVDTSSLVLKSVVASAARAGYTRVGMLVWNVEEPFNL